MSIKAVLFDLDDTLWPIVPVIRRAEDLMYDWLQRHAPQVAQRVSIEGMRQRRQELMRTDPVYQLDLRRLRHAVLAEAFRETGEDEALAEHAMAVFSKARNEVEPYEDVLPVLGRLRSRHRLGTISNGVADLGTIGLAHLFDASVAAWHFGKAKPDPAIFAAACDALEVAPADALYVGDDLLLDVQGAQRAGMRAAWLRRPDLGPIVADGAVQPDLVCASLHELEDWLARQTVKD
ncbi:HAD family hydrolase [Noviherbaspirillum aridicola]|uniref:Hydrolase n=1 Tax=Noviherbaspirillum aridicola TaxID=2849687 RepID=A0ABQ4Q966_9BURK|nr:HAD family hydrolase [Noviherbaspirillum aridicola]GIZ53239.1 hydrolase [Noviherbaspirillum aridicola]